MSFIEQKKNLLNFRDLSGYESLSSELFLKVIFFLSSLVSILDNSKGELQNIIANLWNAIPFEIKKCYSLALFNIKLKYIKINSYSSSV